MINKPEWNRNSTRNWRKKNPDKYRKYMRDYMRKKRGLPG